MAAIVGEAAKLEAAVGLTLGVVAWPLHAVVKIAAANIEIAIRRLSTNGRASQWIGRITWISCLRSAGHGCWSHLRLENHSMPRPPKASVAPGGMSVALARVVQLG